MIPTGVSDLRFAEKINSRYKILEIPNELLAKLRAGEDLVMKGSEVEDVVVCTSQRTYSVKKTESSNSVYLVSPSNCADGLVTINGTCKDYYEVKESKGKTERIFEMFNNSEKTVSRSYLEQNIMASTGEIDTALLNCSAIRLDHDRLTISAIKEQNIILQEIYFQIMYHDDWNINYINEDELLSALQTTKCKDIHRNLFRYILSNIGEERSERTWKLEIKSMIRRGVDIIFTIVKPSIKSLTKEEFEVQLCSIIPELTSLNEELWACINDLVVEYFDLIRSKSMIHYLGRSSPSWPMNIKDRLILLFAIKPHYSLEELVIHLKDLVTNEEHTNIHEQIQALIAKDLKLHDNQYYFKQ